MGMRRFGDLGFLEINVGWENRIWKIEVNALFANLTRL